MCVLSEVNSFISSSTLFISDVPTNMKIKFDSSAIKLLSFAISISGYFSIRLLSFDLVLVDIKTSYGLNDPDNHECI